MAKAPESIMSPEYYPSNLNLNEAKLEFVKIDIDEFRRASFMDRRLRTIAGESIDVRLSDAAQGMRAWLGDGRLKNINYIFHTSFCCSTLIAKCLDIRHKSITFREPGILMQLANIKRMGHSSITDRSGFIGLLEMTLFYLSLSANNNEYVAIKPTNSANNLTEEIMDCASTGRVLLLHSTLERFLISVIKGGEERRAFIRRLFNLIRGDSERVRHLPLEEVMQMTDLQMAAMVWHLHIDQYQYILEKYSARGVKTLDCDDFLDRPMETLGKLVNFFDYNITANTIEQVIAGPVFNSYSKSSDKKYSNAIREKEYCDVLEQHKNELETIIAWSNTIRPDGALKLPLLNAL